MEKEVNKWKLSDYRREQEVNNEIEKIKEIVRRYEKALYIIAVQHEEYSSLIARDVIDN